MNDTTTTFGHAALGDHLTLTSEAYAGSLAGKTVLVAEDNVILSMHLSMVLEDAGARVIGPFPFVHEALAAIQAEVPDLAMLDFALAEGDSGPVANRLRELRVPFAFFTGHPADELAPYSDDAPVVRKPNSDRTIVGTMSGLLAA